MKPSSLISPVSRAPSMAMSPLAKIPNKIFSPMALEVVIVMMPSAKRELEVRSVPRSTKNQMRSCLPIV